MTEPLRVLILDDHPLWRESLERELVAAGINVVASLERGASAAAVAQATRVDLALVDLQLPDRSGVDVVADLMALTDPPRVLVLSASGERGDVLAAVRAGAHGYLTKSATRAELLDAINDVANGDAVFSPGLAALVLGQLRQQQADPAATLTPREIEVLRLVATGMTYRDIAEQLFISHRTVQNHVQSTLRKLHLSNRVELTRYAIREGIGDVETEG